MGYYKNKELEPSQEVRIIYNLFNDKNVRRGEIYKTKRPKKVIFFEVGKLLSTERYAKDIAHITKWDGQVQLSLRNGERFLVRDSYEELAGQL